MLTDLEGLEYGRRRDFLSECHLRLCVGAKEKGGRHSAAQSKEKEILFISDQ